MEKIAMITVSPKIIQPSKELEKLQYLMEMSVEDRNTLEADIEKNGIRDPIKCYQNTEGELFIIGGFNRWQIATNMGFTEIVVDIYKADNTEEVEDLVIDDNLKRRHMTTAQKKAVADYKLSRNPERSNRSIAEETHIDPKTVQAIRKEKEDKEEIPVVAATVGLDGKERKKKRSAIATDHSLKTTLKNANLCPHCGGVL